MKKRKLWFLSLGVILAIVVSISVIATHNNLGFSFLFPTQGDNVDNPDNVPPADDEGPETPIVDTGPRLTCFNFIDLSLQQDGFTHLEGLVWGRGRGVELGYSWTNNFLFDLGELAFAFIDINNHLRPADWYLNYEKYADRIYFHESKKVKTPEGFLNGDERFPFVLDLETYDGDVLSRGNNTMTYSMKTWGEYYVDKFARFGCSVENLTQETMNAYKTQKSTATNADVVSVFDRVSSDGVIRYFADVFQPGRVQDHPRYIEINTLEEFDALDFRSETFDFDNWKQYNLIVLTYHNYSGRTFEQDQSHVDGKVLEHFFKDVLFDIFVDGREVKRTPTAGLYFIYIDNPNGEFEFLHDPVNYAFSGGNSFMDFRTPWESSFVIANVDMKEKREAYIFTGNSYYALTALLDTILYENGAFGFEPGMFAPEFVMHYTRAFSPRWQHLMGLTDLFEERYNLIDETLVRRRR